MLAKIYQPAKTAMQSGHAKSKDWILEFEATRARKIDPLMGWTSSADTSGQVHLKFPTLEAAKQYAEKHNLPYQVLASSERKPAPKSYSENFSFNRRQPWTH
ncbi:MAG: ETC complex I subunit [Pseudomonadota bacterium]